MARAGVDLGGTKIEVLIIEGDQEVLGRARRPTPTEGGAHAIISAIAGAVTEAAAAAGTTTALLTGVGVGSPGAVDEEAGTVAQASNLAGGWEDAFPFAAELTSLVGKPVRIANDVEAAAGAEIELGAGRNLPSFLAIWWGTGVGGSVVLNGKRWYGQGAAGEVGHMVIRLGGRLCPCGRHGCVEAYAGRAAMEARARRLQEHGQKTKLFDLMEAAKRDRLTSGVWQKALEHDDAMARGLIADAYEALAAVAASVLNLLDLNGVILGGGLGTRFGSDGAARIRHEMEPHLFHAERNPAVVPAELGDDGGAIGAALLVR
jgi:glucokinase